MLISLKVCGHRQMVQDNDKSWEDQPERWITGTCVKKGRKRSEFFSPGVEIDAVLQDAMIGASAIFVEVTDNSKQHGKFNNEFMHCT